MIIKLMGKPNSTNAFNFLLGSLKRKWKTQGPWQLIDLPNEYYIVKFHLHEDMNLALCGGPWIISGQTLVVQQWTPEFDPIHTQISKMAVWVRILGLPVRFFKDFTLEKIGKMIGKVVKIDQVTMAQARGKFARLCVEIDLQKPLKPCIGIAGMAYSVVYDGISMICFNCGCYGHAQDSCPYLKRDGAQENSATETTVKTTHAEGGNMQGGCTTTTTNDQASDIAAGAKMQEDKQNDVPATKNENGPWMLMSYKNKRRNSTGPSNNKPKQDSGSRFELLQSFSEGPDGALHEDPPSSTAEINRQPPPEEPKIVKIWRKVREKVNLDPSISNTKVVNADVVVKANVSKPDASIISV